MSINPVVGSVAACCVAYFTKAIAYYTSFYITRSDSLILANASLILINDYNCRVVAVIIFLLLPSFLIYEYASISFSPAYYVKFGWMYCFAYVIYLLNNYFG